MFGDAQLSALADYVQGSLMLRANNPALPPLNWTERALPWPRKNLWRLNPVVGHNLCAAARLLHVPEGLPQGAAGKYIARNIRISFLSEII